MSSFLSSAYTDTAVESQFNAPLAFKALSIRQGKYDANKAEVEQTLSLYKNQLKGLRDVDNNYIAASLKQVEGVINGYGNKDYSITSTKDSLLGNLKSVTEDPIIRSAILNRAKYDKVNAEVAEKKKKNDGSYSDANYAYMLHQGGFDSYMKGETKDLGNLEYTNYIDSIKIIKDDIDKWGKDYGIQAEWTKEGKAGDLIYTDVKHNVLSKQEVLLRMKTVLNPQIMTQFKIDAWAHYKDVPKELVEKDITQFYTSENAKEDVNIANAKAQKVGATKAQIAELDAYISNLTANKNTNTEKLNSKNYNIEQEKTIIYTNSLLNGLAESYQKDDEVERVTNDSNLDIAKFNVDVEYKKASLEQGQQRIDIAKEANSLADTANVIASGAGVKVDTKDTTDKRTPTEAATQANSESYKNLTTLLAEESKEYKALTTDEQRASFINGITKESNAANVNTENYSADLVEAIDDFKAKSSTMQKGRQAIVNTITPALINSYDAMVGSKKINLDNLAKTAPITASFLKRGLTLDQIQKQVDYKGNPIGKQNVAMIKHEMAVNSLNSMNVGGEDERHSLELYIKNLENQSYLTNEQKVKMRSKDKQEYGVMEGSWDVISGVAGYAGNAIKGAANEVFNVLSGDYDSYNKDLKAEEEAKQKNVAQIHSGMERGYANAADRWGGMSDTNLSEIQFRDLNKTDKVKNIAGAITTALITATQEKNKEYIKLKPNTYNTEAISFNPKDAKGKKIIESVILPQLSAISGGTPITLEKGTMITASMPPGSTDIQVTYTPEKGEQTTVSISGEYMPGLKNSLYMKSPNHMNSKLNDNAPPRAITYETPVDTKNKFDLLKKINKNFGEGVISSTLVAGMGEKGSPMETQVSLRAYGKKATPEVQQQINQIAESPYQVVWEQQGGKFVGTLRDAYGKAILVDGEEVLTVLNRNGVPSNYSAGEARLQTIQLINDAKKKQIEILLEE